MLAGNRTITILTLLVAFFFPNCLAIASEDLNVREWLSKPGVKLLAVEFYSVSCGPCMAAVPKWKLLQEKHFKDGLRLVVVSADADVCAKPDWEPDGAICDTNQVLQSNWEVDYLPQAFLFDWEGNVIAARSRVEQVSEAVEKYLLQVPRILVEVPTGENGIAISDAAEVESYIKEELGRQAKFDIVSNDDDRARLEEIQKRGHDPSHNRTAACPLGQRISANTLLKSRVTNTQSGRLLVMELQSVGTACSLVTVTQQLGNDIRQSVRAGVSRLLDGIVRVKDPGEIEAGVGPTMARRDSKIVLEVEPKGGRWSLDKGESSGTVSPEKRFEMIQVSPGRHSLYLELDGHIPIKREFVIEKRELQTIKETMIRKPPPPTGSGKGFIVVTSTPVEGAAIFVDGKDTGLLTPSTLEDIPEGKHELLVRCPLFKDATKSADVSSENFTKVSVPLESNSGNMEITSSPSGADLYIDGVKQVGTTPVRKERTESRAYKVKLTYAQHHDLEAIVFVAVGKNKPQHFKLKPAFGSVTVAAYSQGEELKGAQVSLGYDAKGVTPLALPQVLSGKYMLTVKKPLFRDFTKEVEIRDGESARFEAEMEARYGTLVVTPTPRDSEVFIDGVSCGKGRVEKALSVGEHRVAVKGPNKTFADAEKTVAVALLETTRLPVELRQMQGALLVVTSDLNADVLLDGQRVATGPARIDRIPVGTHSVRLEQRGFASFETSVNIVDGKAEKVKAELSPLSSLKVTCEPGGEIFLDGTKAGFESAEVKTLSDGKHVVKCTASGRVGVTREINAVAGEQLNLRMKLDSPETLSIRYEEDRWAHVRDGGISVASGILALVGAYLSSSYFEGGGNRQAVSWGLAGTGGVLVGLGGYLLATPPSKPPFLSTAVKDRPIGSAGVNGNKHGEEDLRDSDSGLKWLFSVPAGISFSMTEVTVGQYRACVNAGACGSKHHQTKADNKYCNWGYTDRDNHPMNCIDWYGADAFCMWAGGRLPTEREWYAEASNGGTRTYPWGKEVVTCSLAIWGDGSNTDGCGKDSTWPVCSKPSGNSVSGLCDQSGNVWEWTSSSYDREHLWWVLRGGSWCTFDPESLRALLRNWGGPDYRSNSVGFRCGRSSR